MRDRMNILACVKKNKFPPRMKGKNNGGRAAPRLITINDVHMYTMIQLSSCAPTDAILAGLGACGIELACLSPSLHHHLRRGLPGALWGGSKTLDR